MLKQTPRSPRKHWLTVIALIIFLQAVAAAFFLMDAVLDIALGVQVMDAFYHSFELLVAIALVAGVVMGMMVLRRLVAEAKQRERTMALARGALAEIVEQRFAEWRLTEAESEVALFAIKGYGIAEIAQLRDAAMGTVRAQLSRIYVKAGVTSQAMLIGGLIDEFIDVVPVRDSRSAPTQSVPDRNPQVSRTGTQRH